MENGGQKGARTDHPRDAAVNGIHGAKSIDKSRPTPQKGKMTPVSNDHEVVGEVGGNGGGPSSRQPSSDRSPRMNDLPDEIIHITQGFVPLSTLLTRLAQVSHNALQDKIMELAKMPVSAASVNGNSGHAASTSDDMSPENIRKKAVLLNFAHDMHSKWVKALVILEWSRKASKVSKLIDLKYLLDQERILFDAALDRTINVKRDLTFARMPSPDLKTALQVLSTGMASWMPDLQYVEPPPLTPDVQLKWINELNTLLSLRLNLEDYDKIPHQFRNYDISCGRVTFRVAGEFEVDLTIADEDFEKQFWFIDFRFAFRPAASCLADSLRGYLEGCVNDVLAKDGLDGCYRFLHEFVLTSKIHELRRQAMRLARSSWTGTLVVEPLNRALAIQYWTSRNPSTGLKSWVLVAVHSGRRGDGRAEANSPSHLEVKWYRDNKEVKDGRIEMDAERLSAETLLKSVIGRHVEHLLSSIHERLLTAPRFKNREAGMTLRISRSDPRASSLAVQVGYSSTVSLLIEPTTGAFAVKPHSKFSVHHEHQLNNGKYPVEDGMNCLERVRCAAVEDELVRKASSMGWCPREAMMSPEELRGLIKMREWTRTIWLQRRGWGPRWSVVVILSLGGDEWWLVESSDGESQGNARFIARLPLSKGHPDMSGTFWTKLTLFVTGMIAQWVDRKELHRQGIKSKTSENLGLALPREVRLPTIEIALSDLVPAMGSGGSRGEATQTMSRGGEAVDAGESTAEREAARARPSWAHDSITLSFKGACSLRKAKEDGTGDEAPTDDGLTCTTAAILRVRERSKFAGLRRDVDRDVSYCPQRGEFSFRIRRSAVEPVLGALVPRIKAIDRFVKCLEAMEAAGPAIKSESATMSRVSFHYGGVAQKGGGGGGGGGGGDAAEDGPEEQKLWRLVLDLSQEDIKIELEADNRHLRAMDLMTRLVNTEGGVGALMAWLPLSLTAMSALETMESGWEELGTRGLGWLELSTKSVTWMSLRYTLGPMQSGPGGPRRQACLELKVQARRGEAWWCLWRSGGEADDEIGRALRPVWEGKGERWQGFATSAAGRPDGGVAAMLSAVDEAMRALAGTPTAEVAVMGIGATTAGPSGS